MSHYLRNRSVLSSFTSVEEFANEWSKITLEHLPPFPVEDCLLGKRDDIKTLKAWLFYRQRRRNSTQNGQEPRPPEEWRFFQK